MPCLEDVRISVRRKVGISMSDTVPIYGLRTTHDERCWIGYNCKCKVQVQVQRQVTGSPAPRTWVAMGSCIQNTVQACTNLRCDDERLLVTPNCTNEIEVSNREIALISNSGHIPNAAVVVVFVVVVAVVVAAA